METNNFQAKLPLFPMGFGGAGLPNFNTVPFSFVVGTLLLIWLLLLFDTPTTLLLIFLFELLFLLLLILCPATTDAIRSLVVDVLLVLITGGDEIVWIFCIFAFIKFFHRIERN